MNTLYGISNCDTIKKAKKWLEANDIQYQFHDYRKHGVSAELLSGFAEQLGLAPLVNKRGTTYRGLSEEDKKRCESQDAIALLVEHPAMIKRPVLVTENSMHLGFKDADYAAIFNL